MYIERSLEGDGLRITRLARGLPVGGDLEYVDPGDPDARNTGALRALVSGECLAVRSLVQSGPGGREGRA